MNRIDKKKFDLKNLKYVPKHFTTLLFFLGWGIVLVLFYGRKSEFFRSEFLLGIMPDFYLHISNFSISYLLYVGIGYFWLMMGIKFKNIIFLGIALFLANLIYELFIPILNTPDIVDAYFGFVGTLFGFLFLLFVKRYGLNRNSLSN